MTRWSVLLFALCACAKVSPPGGGPIDRTPPQVVGTAPAADATSVTTGQAIYIDFDEPMDRKSTQEAIFVTPASKLDAVWETATRLRLVLKAGLVENRTYVVTLGTEARDLRSNRLEEAFQFAFSTGDALDRGTLTGRVVNLQGPQRGVTVWAYDLEHFSGQVGADAPAYVTQTGTDGGFRFERLASTRYRLLGFQDDDRDRELGKAEARALNSVDVSVSDVDTTRAGDLRLFSPLVAATLKRISALDQHRLLLVFDRTVDVESLTINIDGLEVQAIHVAPADSTRIHVRTGRQVPGKTYRPVIRLAGEAIDIDEPVRGSGREDTQAPKIVRTQPGATAIELREILFTFDEVMAPKLPGADFWLPSHDLPTPEGEWRWQDPLRLVFELTSPLAQGHLIGKGRWSVVSDLAGNVPTDTLDVAIEVVEVSARPSLEGAIRLAAGIEATTVRIIASTDTESYAMAAVGDTMKVSHLPPGKYQVHGYADTDGDGYHDPGQVDPYRAAEPFGWLGTVELRPSTTTRVDLDIR